MKPERQHRVELSNGQVLLVIEDESRLHLATETTGHRNDVDMYVCVIERNGVTVMPNSGTAVWDLTEGLPAAAPAGNWEE